MLQDHVLVLLEYLYNIIACHPWCSECLEASNLLCYSCKPFAFALSLGIGGLYQCWDYCPERYYGKYGAIRTCERNC